MEEKHFGQVWFIPGDKRGNYPFCNSIYVEGPAVLIDPASDRRRLVQLSKDTGVKEIWLTHWHEDHIMHLDLFDDLPLSVSGPDADPLSDLELFMDAYGMEEEDYRQYWRTLLKEQFHFRPRTPARLLKGGDIIHLGKETVEVINTPGHTLGHLSFFFKESGVLFTGDYDLTNFGPWYGDVNSSIEETIASVELLRTIPARIWITGHGAGLLEQEPGNIWDRYLNVIAEREEKLLNLLHKPKTMKNIVGASIIYGKPREPKAFFEFAEQAKMKKHLEKLMKQGVVAMDGESYYLL